MLEFAKDTVQGEVAKLHLMKTRTKPWPTGPERFSPILFRSFSKSMMDFCVVEVFFYILLGYLDVLGPEIYC